MPVKTLFIILPISEALLPVETWPKSLLSRLGMGVREISFLLDLRESPVMVYSFSL